MGSFCLCDVGFTGPFCETPIECIHGSITVENSCSCEPNWVGEDCSQCAYGRFCNHSEDRESKFEVLEKSILKLILVQ